MHFYLERLQKKELLVMAGQSKVNIPWLGMLLGTFMMISANPAMALNLATPHVEADYFWSQGYTGVGVEIGIIDLFLADSSHPAIQANHLGNEVFVKGAAWISDHATMVTGAAVSQDGTHTGVAPGAGWWSAQTTKRSSLSTIRTQTVAAETFAQGLRGLAGNPVEVITLSIGFAGVSDASDQWSLALDHIVNTNGSVITVSAGNDGPAISSMTGLPNGAYNIITVGATGDTLGSPSEDYTRVADFSSRGPTSDGRIKPDIVAPGSLLHLPTLGSNWADGNGTSFATPLVAGGAALLKGMGIDLGFVTDPKLIKSVLLNSADKLAGWSHSPTQPLDFNQGAGQMNLRKAFEQYLPGEQDPGTVGAVGWDTQAATEASETFYTLDANVLAGEFVTATLVWDRIVTTNTEDIDSAVYSVDHFDNLDLMLYAADDLSTPLVSSISQLDNVEHIRFAVPQNGQYVLGVRMTGASPGDSETYGLTWETTGDPFALGDFNFSGDLDASDLMMLYENRGGVDLDFDLNGDLVIDNDDAEHWVTVLLGTAMTDFNLDFSTDVSDLNIWKSNRFTTNKTMLDGDVDKDNVVDVSDLNFWKTNRFQTHGSLSVTPEPATLSLLAVGGLVCLRRRKSKGAG